MPGRQVDYRVQVDPRYHSSRLLALRTTLPYAPANLLPRCVHGMYVGSRQPIHELRGSQRCSAGREGSLPMSVHQRQGSFLMRGWGIAYRLPWVDPWLSRSSLAVDANAHRDSLSAPVATMLAGLVACAMSSGPWASAHMNLRGRDAGPTPRFRAVDTAESYWRGRSAPSLTASRVAIKAPSRIIPSHCSVRLTVAIQVGGGYLYISRSRQSSETDNTEKARHAIPRALQRSSQCWVPWVPSYILTSPGKKKMECCSQAGLVPFAVQRLR